MDKSEQVMMEFWDIFNKRIWLDETRMKERLKGYTPSEIHCMEYIGKHADSNVTKLADAFYMTRSAISKLTKKLMEKNLIISYRKPDNKKEIYFRLTAQGESVYTIHEDLHQESRDRDKAVLGQVSEEQYDSMLRFAKMYNNHLDREIEKLGADSTAGYYDKL